MKSLPSGESERLVERGTFTPRTLRERSEVMFLCSMAEMAGQRAVAIMLSGLDGDDRAALKAIKAAGGLTFAQSDAAYDSMPRSAVETGHVDHLMPAVEIAKALSALAHEPLKDAKKPDNAGLAA